MAPKRKYPAGIQDFESLRRDGYVYVDKTHLIYKMITEGYPYFLSRPRRFGKSLLVSTLEAVFEGLLALQNGIQYDEMLEKLKRTYDGYHFSKALTDIYNPFSLVNAFGSGELKDYWFGSATPGSLIDLLSNMPSISLQDIDGVACESSAFDRPFNSYEAVLPVLYQSGYLTIKDYDRELEEYTLGFPNQEVSKGFADCLYRYATHRQNTDDKDKGQLLRAYKVFRRDDELPPFIDAVKAFFAGIPYQLSDKEKGRDEHYYHALLYTLLMAFGADVTAEESTVMGRSDIVLRMPKGIYVIEIKCDKPAKVGLKQIDDKDYYGKYRLDGRPLTKVALCFGSQDRNIVKWDFVGTK